MLILFVSVILLPQFNLGAEIRHFETVNLSTGIFTVTDNRAFEGTINSTLECIRNEMNQGLPEWGLPHFKPLQIAGVAIDLNATGIEGVSGLLHFEDITVAGLTDWTVTALKGVISLLPPSYKADVAMNFPQIVLAAKYEINVTIGGYNIWGEGILAFEAVDFNIIVNFKTNIVGKFNLQYFKFTPSLSTLRRFIISGLRCDEAFSYKISQYIQAKGPKLVGLAGPKLSKIIENGIVNLVNNGEEDGLFAELRNRCRKTI